MASSDDEVGRDGLARLIPERRIYVRGGRATQYFLLTPPAQLGTLTAIALFIGWSGFATHTFVATTVDTKGTQVRMAAMQEAYEARIAAMESRQIALEEELNRANERRDAATARLSEKQQNLVQATHQLNEAESELAALRLEIGDLTRSRRAAEDSVERLAGELIAMQLEAADAVSSRDGLLASLGSVSGAIDRVISERDFAIARRETLGEEVAALEKEVTTLTHRQDRLLAQLEGATETGLSGLETMFSRANLDLDRIMNELKRDYTGSGGPFQPFAEDEDINTQELSEEADLRVAALIQDLERVNLMRFAADRLPFVRPVDGGRFTSGFGPRRDPKRGRTSMHAGIDIAGPRGTPVHTTADGVVTFAGRQRGYGKVIKIRHAFGFETVYAHLDRMRVTVGQRVSRGDLIADMGNTGRSTGTHLHYEVRIDNQPVNPMKFIEAARDVL